MIRRQVSLPRFGNCLLFVLALWFTGRLLCVLYKPPWHWMGMLKGWKRLVHFKSTKKHDRFQPLFFEGVVEVIEL